MTSTHTRREVTDHHRTRQPRRRTMAAVAVLSAALLGTATIAIADVPSRPAALETTAFTLIDPGQFSEPAPTPASVVAPPAPVVVPKIVDFDAPAPLSDDEAEERFGQPNAQANAKARAIIKTPPRPKVTQSAGGSKSSRTVRGTATWYCKPGVSSCHYAHSSGMYAAAGREIRIGDWRGRKVRVCQGGDCIYVTLIDWCGCKGERIIDLYSDAYRKLDSLSSGVLPVTVSW
ncbi:MAG TPA: hypothetical protein VD763_09145 [Candidatus Saccharimonadales bacterium]|nr:hypothetical protein [Candidatus Saccharimonadales bacterium]